MSTTSKLERWISRLGTDFDFFLSELWKDRGLDRRAPLGEVEWDIARWAAHGPRRRGVLALRGVGKTHVGVAVVTVFRGFRDPDRKIIIPSKSLDAAKKTTRLIREWLDRVWFLQHLAPGRDQRDAATYLDFGPSREDRQPSITAIGIDGQLENNRARSHLPDDVETKGNTKTVDARLELRRIVKEFTNILYPDRPADQGGPVDPVEICYFGTPKHEETLYGELAKPDTGYAFRAWPIAYPSPDEKVLNLAPMLQEKLDKGLAKPGDPTVPHRFNETEIAIRQAEGRTEFAMESMLIADLASSNRYPLHLRDLMVMEVHRDRAPVAVMYGTRDHNGSTVVDDIPHLGLTGDHLHRPAKIDEGAWGSYTGTKAGIDPSGRGADKTGLAVVGHLAGLFYVKHVSGLEGGSSTETLEQLALLCREHDARDIYFETNADILGTFRTVFEPVLRRFYVRPGEDSRWKDGWAATIVDDPKVCHSTGQKEVGIIAAIEPVTSTHRLIVDRSVVANPEFQRQFTRITKERNSLGHEDEIDALRLVLRAWQYALRVDPDVAAGRSRERVAQDEIDRQRKALDKLLGRPSRSPRWFQHR